MKKVFILLFPQKEYLGTRQNNTFLFNECIKERYISKGYEFFVVKFKGSDLGIISLTPNRIIEADISFEQSSPVTSKDWRYANFKTIANQLNINNYEQVVLGGFHCFDCVEKFANEIVHLNNNILIDTDLTEQFWNVAQYQTDWDIREFKPEQKLERVLSLDDYTPSGILKKIKKRYENTIWGISDETIKKIEDKIKLQIEDKSSLLNK